MRQEQKGNKRVLIRAYINWQSCCRIYFFSLIDILRSESISLFNSSYLLFKAGIALALSVLVDMLYANDTVDSS